MTVWYTTLYETISGLQKLRSVYKTISLFKQPSCSMAAPFVFKHPFTSIIAGPSQSGKTEFTTKLLANSWKYIYPPPHKVTWFYGQNNPLQFQRMKNKIFDENPLLEIDFIGNTPSQTLIDDLDTSKNNLIVLDDLMNEANKSKDVSNIFTRKSHHQNLSVIMIVQNIYSKNKFTTDINRNVKYLILFKNPRDKVQIDYLSRQMNLHSNPGFISRAYEAATTRPHGYLIIDCDQRTSDENRAVTGIFPPEELPLRYIPIT